MVKRLSLVLATCAIAACGGAIATQARAQADGQAQTVKDRAPGYKRIGAVAVTADKLTWYFVGATVLTNEREEKDVASWDLDKAFADQLGKASERVFEATYVAAPYAASDFAGANDNRTLDFTPYATWMTQKIGGVAQRLCDANALDALLVASKQNRDDMWGSRQSMGALGIAGKSNPFVDPPYFAYVSSRVSLYDCRLSRVLATRILGYVPGGKYTELTMRMRRIPYEIAKVPPSQWDEAARDKIRALIVETPGPSWEETVRAIVTPPDETGPAKPDRGLTP